MKKIIVGNACGSFSTLLKFFSWMEVEECNDISVHFYWKNKTKRSGNTSLDKLFENANIDILSNDLFSTFFNFPQKTLIENFNFQDTYHLECYPSDLGTLNIPSSLVYAGRGSYMSQYYSDLSHIRNSFNKQWKKFELSDSLNKKYESEKLINGENVLCVMLRCSAHYYGHFDMNSLLNDIENCLIENQCNKIYILTQVEPFLNQIIERFGQNMCMFPNRKRNPLDSDWDGGSGIEMSDEKFIIEAQESIIDVLNASNCSHIISGASNMLLGALSFNPEIKYSIYQTIGNRDGA